MYLNHFKLKAKPFQISTDPGFLWLGDKHREALAVLRYGIMDNKGFLLLTGDVGTGKTTLIHALINALDGEVVIANVPDPGLEIPEFFAYIARSFNLDPGFSGKFAFLSMFETFLNRVHEKKKKVLLIIDEAQRMDQKLLEEIRLLSNIEKQSTKLINIFFVGQSEFNSIILEERNAALRQRITVNYDLGPLSEEETGQYIRHRLKVAGRTQPIFKSGAVREIHKFSKGYPRLINVICDRALITAYTIESQKIGTAVIRECADEVRLRGEKVKKKVSDEIKKPDRRITASVDADRPRSGKKSLYFILAGLIVIWIAIAWQVYAPESLHRIISIFSNSGRSSDSVNKFPITVKLEDESPKDLPGPTNEPADVAGKNIEKPQPEKTTVPIAPSDQTEKIQLVFDRDIVMHIDLSDTNDISPDGFVTLDKLAMIMENDKALTITMKGCFKSLGSNQYNKKMSEFSANIVKGYLVGKGVQPPRIETMGMVLLNSEEDGDNGGGVKEGRWVEIQFK